MLPAFLSLILSQVIGQNWAFFAAPAIAVASGYTLAKALSLFAADDTVFLNHVKMPSFVRRGDARMYRFLAKGKP